MNKKTNTSYLYVVLIVTLGGFIFGLDVALISGTLDYLKAEFGLSEMAKGLVASASAWGALVALPLTSVISERFGRKKALILVAFLYTLSAIYSTLAGSAVSLGIARFIGGLAFSSLSLASMYIGEVAPANLRGKLVSLNQINISIGLLVAFLLNYLIIQSIKAEATFAIAWGIDQYTWRWMLGIEIIPALIWFCLLLTIPESPYWLVSKNRIADAKKVLTTILPSSAEGKELEAEVAEKVESIAATTNSSDDSAQSSPFAQVKELFTSPRLRKILIIGVSVAMAQQVIGINAIKFYAPSLFEQLAIGRDSAFLSAIWVGLAGLFATLLSLAFIDRLGRRPIAVGGMAVMVACLGICAFGFKTASYTITSDAIIELEQTIPGASALKAIEGEVFSTDVDFKDALKETLGESDAYKHSGLLLQECATINSLLILIAVLVFVAAYSFSLGPVVWVLLSEIVPTSLRSGVIPFFALITSLVSAFVQNFFPWQLDVWGAGNTFLMFMLMGGVILLIIYFNLVETKNKTIEQIEEELIIKTK